MTHTLDAEQEGIVAKVEKLLALAKNNSNENEAQAATAKAMELLAAYNLDMAVLGGSTDKTGKRDDRRLKGGLYGWQRDLWNAVAELNFCKYRFIRGLRRGSSYEHRIVGRMENVASTKVMSDYLQNAIERLTVEFGKEEYPGQSRFIRPLIAYREGMAARIAERLRAMRWQRVQEDRRKAEEARTRSSHGGNALVLADVINTEEDLNNDYLFGKEPGWHAAQRAASKARQAAANAAYDAQMKAQAEWDAAHPVEAAQRKAKEAADYAAQTAKWAAEDARRAKAVVRERKMTSREERMQSEEFYAGYDKGNEVGLDKQIDNKSTRRIG